MTGSPHFRAQSTNSTFIGNSQRGRNFGQLEMPVRQALAPSSRRSVRTTEFVTLTVTQFVEKLPKVLHSLAFWN